jgi:hypothetical protein
MFIPGAAAAESAGWCVAAIKFVTHGYKITKDRIGRKAWATRGAKGNAL